jgi:hypothetical protein
MKTVKKAQVGKKIPSGFKKANESDSTMKKRYPGTSSKSEKSSAKKPEKYYSELDAGRGDYSKPRTEKQQKQWEKEEEAMINYKGRPKMKKGGAVKKAKSGSSLGMKSVKAGFDKNPGVTRADIIVAGKKQAKKGAKIGAKKMMGGGKCKYGCK